MGGFAESHNGWILRKVMSNRTFIDLSLAHTEVKERETGLQVPTSRPRDRVYFFYVFPPLLYLLVKIRRRPSLFGPRPPLGDVLSIP